MYELSIIGTSTAQQKLCVYSNKKNIPCPLRQILLCECIAYDTSTYDRPNTRTQLPAPIVSMRNGSCKLPIDRPHNPTSLCAVQYCSFICSQTLEHAAGSPLVCRVL
jgi:hypothetical protein